MIFLSWNDTVIYQTLDSVNINLYIQFHLILGGRYKNWKRRWFILNDNCLYYFEFTQVIDVWWIFWDWSAFLSKLVINISSESCYLLFWEYYHLFLNLSG